MTRAKCGSWFGLGVIRSRWIAYFVVHNSLARLQLNFVFGLFSFLRDLRAKGGILSDWLYRCRFALIGSASNHPIVSRCDITHGKASVSISARFEESEHVGDAFFLSGNEIDAQVWRQTLPLGDRNATAKTGAAFGDRDGQTRNSLTRFQHDSGTRNVGTGRSRRRRSDTYRFEVPTGGEQTSLKAVGSGREIAQVDLALIIGNDFRECEKDR